MIAQNPGTATVGSSSAKQVGGTAPFLLFCCTTSFGAQKPTWDSVLPHLKDVTWSNLAFVRELGGTVILASLDSDGPGLIPATAGAFSSWK
ncbi:hypothetical protein PG997_002419 [Apiospora hydei]|uniref:Uncharacterized protein n=1 Tax=Apiospora hydei TaxID=1337664 RepID=A0ABR1X9J7_9PEZI